MKTEIVKVSIDNLIKEFNKIQTDTIALIIDQKVYELYKKQLGLDLIDKNKKLIIWKAPSGESLKSIRNYESCMEYLISKNIHRKTHLVAVGGGAVGDFAGFIAATTLRGINWSVVPTTLLSIVDSSVGGKVAINSKDAKNQIGAFHHPEKIFYCEKFLDTLGREEVLAGKGEILKYAFLDKNINDKILAGANLSKVMQHCIEYKKKITEQDFKEDNIRKFLNFGHTLGHGIEKHYGLAHGVAVYWGMLATFVIFERDDLINNFRELANSLNCTLKESPWLNKTFPMVPIMESIRKDKKVISQSVIDFVEIKKIGEPEVVQLKLNSLEEKIKKATNELRKIVL